MKTKMILNSLMLATFLLSGAQALAAEATAQAEAEQNAQSSQAGLGRIEVCFDHPGQFKARHSESGFSRSGQPYDFRPGKYDGALN